MSSLWIWVENIFYFFKMKEFFHQNLGQSFWEYMWCLGEEKFIWRFITFWICRQNNNIRISWFIKTLLKRNKQVFSCQTKLSRKATKHQIITIVKLQYRYQMCYTIKCNESNLSIKTVRKSIERLLHNYS